MKISRRGFFKRVGAVTALAGIAAFAGDLSGPVELPVGNKKLKVFFNLGPHATAANARKLEPIVRDFKPHVVCIELETTGENRAKQLEERYYSLPPEKLSLGSFTDFVKAEQDVLRKYHPKVFVLERFLSEELFDKFIELTKRQIDSSVAVDTALAAGDAGAAIRAHRELIQAEGETAELRERGIKAILSDLHGSLVRRYPELANEKEIRVVVRYGGAHTTLYQHARTVGFSGVERKVMTPLYFDSSTVVVRHALFGLSRKHSDADVAKNLAAGLLAVYAENLGANSGNSAAFGNLFAKKVNLDQFHQILSSGGLRPQLRTAEPDPWNVLSQEAVRQEAQSISQDAERYTRDLPALFQREGIKLPASKQEVHAFLEKKIGRRRLAPD